MKNFRSLALAAFATVALASFASADLFTYTIPAGGITTDGELDDPTNFFTSFDLGVDSVITGVGYNVTLTSRGESYRSEAAFLLENTDLSAGVYVTPGFEDDSPGGPTNYTSGGLIDLSDAGLDDIALADGIANLQFFETFDDAGGTDGFFAAGGTITVEYTPGAPVPEPASMAVLGLGAAALLRRRKAKKA